MISLRNLRVPLVGALVLFVLAACGAGDGEAGEGSGPSSEAKKPLVALRDAPPFELETLEGDSLEFDDLSDREVVLMNFWASWCGPCRAEVPDLIALHEAYRDEGFMVLGVTVNDIPKDSRAFVEEMGMTYPSVIGTPAMLEDYRLSPWLPTTILVKDGEIVREWVGPRSREEFEYPIKVALGMVPDLMDVVKPGGEANRSSEGPPAGAEPARPPAERPEAGGETAPEPDEQERSEPGARE